MKIMSNAERLAGDRALQDARKRAGGSLYKNISTRGTGASNISVNSYSDQAKDLFESKYEEAAKAEDTRKKQYYTQLQNASESLQDHMSVFLKRGENALFGTGAAGSEEGAGEEKQPDRDKIKKEIAGFVEDYNTMLKKMERIGGKVCELYTQQLHKQAAAYQEELEELGITRDSNGWLSADNSVLEKADLEKIESLFGTSDSFAGKVTDIGRNIEQNARDNLYAMKLSSYSSGYDQSGSYAEDYNNIWNRYSSKG